MNFLFPVFLAINATLNNISTESDTSNILGIIVQAVLASATIILVVVTWRNMKKTNEHTEKQLALTRKEIESRLRADLRVTPSESNLETKGDMGFEGKFVFVLHNDGTMTARNIRIHFQDPTMVLTLEQLVREWKKIKNTTYPIKGVLPAGWNTEHVVHRTHLDESRVYEIAIWVQYDFADVKDEEFIQIVKINAQHNSLSTVYDKNSIEKARKELDNKGIPF